MATTYLFNSAAAAAARVSLKADTVTGVKTIEVRDAANDLNKTITLTAGLIAAVLAEWRRNEQGFVELDGANNVFVAFPGDASSVWPNSAIADENTATDEVILNAGKTAVLMSWLDQYTVP